MSGREDTPRYAFGSAFAACMVIIVFGASNLGINCGPQPTNGDCACTPPQDTICGRCITPLQQGQSGCTDECGGSPCASGLSCFLGTCALLGGPSAACTQNGTCGTGFYCRSQTCPNSIQDGFDHCTAYNTQDEPCLSPASIYNCSAPDPCEKCDPGTSCTSGACVKSCGTDADCCGPFPTCLHVQAQIPSSQNNANFCGGAVSTIADCGSSGCSVGPDGCYACASGLGAQCDFGHPCCVPGQACPVDSKTGTGHCCIPPPDPSLPHVTCTSNSQCCSGGICSSGTCCLPSSTTCQSDGQCCGGLKCINGTCQCGPATHKCTSAEITSGACSADLSCCNDEHFVASNGSVQCACIDHNAGACTSDTQCCDHASDAAKAVGLSACNNPGGGPVCFCANGFACAVGTKPNVTLSTEPCCGGAPHCCPGNGNPWECVSQAAFNSNPGACAY